MYSQHLQPVVRNLLAPKIADGMATAMKMLELLVWTNTALVGRHIQLRLTLSAMSMSSVFVNAANEMLKTITRSGESAPLSGTSACALVQTCSDHM